MKKLVLVFLVLLGMSTSAIAEIAVYKVSSRVTGCNGDGVASRWNARGYLVLDIDPVTGAINDSALVWYGNDPERTKLQTTEDGVADVWVVGDGPIVGVEIFCTDFWGYIVGTVRRPVNIGAGVTANIPSSLRGSVTSPETAGWFFLDDPVFGGGTVSVRLDSRATRQANEDELDFDAAVERIQDQLDAKGYAAVA